MPRIRLFIIRLDNPIEIDRIIKPKNEWQRQYIERSWLLLSLGTMFSSFCRRIMCSALRTYQCSYSMTQMHKSFRCLLLNVYNFKCVCKFSISMSTCTHRTLYDTKSIFFAYFCINLQTRCYTFNLWLLFEFTFRYPVIPIFLIVIIFFCFASLLVDNGWWTKYPISYHHHHLSRSHTHSHQAEANKWGVKLNYK